MKVKILIGALIALILLLIALRILSPNKTKKILPLPVITFSPSPKSSPTDSRLSVSLPTLKTVVGKTTEQEVSALSGIESKTTLSDNKVEYLFQSEPTLKSHSIITQNHVVVFEKGKKVEDGLKLPKASSYFNTYGQREAEFTGSKLYGKFEKTYVYAAKGFAIIANPFTDEVDSLQIFLPMSVADYLKTWGQDIDQSQSGQEQF